jgi:hypothetical protein
MTTGREHEHGAAKIPSYKPFLSRQLPTHLFNFLNYTSTSSRPQYDKTGAVAGQGGASDKPSAPQLQHTRDSTQVIAITSIRLYKLQNVLRHPKS